MELYRVVFVVAVSAWGVVGCEALHASTIWRCTDDAGRVTYSPSWCPETGRIVRGVEANVWEWAKPVVDKVVQAGVPPGQPGAELAAHGGMGPANSAYYKNCSGAACDLPGRGESRK